MEFPDLGKHCGVRSCKQLDFLPFTCDACGKIFCQFHKDYKNHSCEESYKIDNQVPTCPICGTIIALKPGVDPNVAVNDHITSGCSKPKEDKTYSNGCSKPGCKKREAIAIHCATCKLPFCLKHRFESDHDCKGKEVRREKVASAALRRSQAPKASAKKPQNPGSNLRNGLGHELDAARRNRATQRSTASNDTDLDAAIALSLATHTSGNGNAGMDEDEELALAIAASLENQEKEKKKKNETGCLVQ
eukprot:m.69700 g.69700  ORF g.69700 m.69700 type:complete len:247 (-) comp12078_c0_seq3:157-897(-)